MLKLPCKSHLIYPVIIILTVTFAVQMLLLKLHLPLSLTSLAYWIMMTVYVIYGFIHKSRLLLLVAGCYLLMALNHPLWNHNATSHSIEESVSAENQSGRTTTISIGH